MVHMACDSLLALHWSKHGGIGMTEMSIGVVGLLGGLINTWLAWQNAV
jgi:hypothetical protein